MPFKHEWNEIKKYTIKKNAQNMNIFKLNIGINKIF